MVECEVPLVVEGSSIVQGRAVVELVEGDNVIRVGIGQGKMSYEPACTGACQLALSCCQIE